MAITTDPISANPAATDAASQPAGEHRVLRTVTNYADAQRIVDTLADEDFPVQNLRIVGDELQLIEQVIGSLSWGKVLLQGLASGAMMGLLITLIFSFFAILAPGALLTLLGYGIVVGAVLGAIFRTIGYALTGGNRDFQSVSGMRPSRYLVMCAPGHADDAERRLSAASL